MRNPVKLFFLFALALFGSCGLLNNGSTDSSYWAGQYEAFIHQDTLFYSMEIKISADAQVKIAAYDWRFRKLEEYSTIASIDPKGSLQINWGDAVFHIDSGMHNTGNEHWPDFYWNDVQSHYQINERQWDLNLMEGFHDVLSSKEPITLFTQGDTLFGGFASCNSYGGELILKEPSQMEFKQIHSTLLFCESMELEEQFFEKLKEVRSYKMVDAEHLQLKNVNGVSVLFFKRHSWLR
ncbi:META domain-containing protein [Croceimicrobium hydrocarbonivorans]|uniref:META domain-containing protein n=1 Tax=Croceimicrobium hydrocarbonivorans TaxID=2761580 RepID=A0A7H0VEF0_9FLAO|nr:META domain-containing protein [Croceimicrobium hydrocarbonivorans]QNR24098.1 META domain-containing protein [Croceimicrobium hydrocarbonivorans]